MASNKMASITIRKLDDHIKTRLKVRAAHRGHSMEEEARVILSTVLCRKEEDTANWIDDLRRPFLELGGVELDIPTRDAHRAIPDLSSDDYS